jgi:glycosyltransferase involved in cell wall biosynthesis
VTYNRASFLPEAIESVQAQSLVNWEMIIVDDASNDNTKEIVEHYCVQDARIQYYRNEKHLKISESRNRSLSYSKGRYVAILDSDDLWCDPLKLEKQCSFLDSQPDHAVVGCGVVVIDKDGKEIKRYLNPQTDKEIRNDIYRRNPFAHSSVMYRRKVVVEMGGYDTSLDTAEDYDLYLRLGGVGKFMNIQKYFLKYRVHSGNITIIDRLKTMEINVSLIKKYKRKYPSYPNALIRRVGRLWAYRLFRFFY